MDWNWSLHRTEQFSGSMSTIRKMKDQIWVPQKNVYSRLNKWFVWRIQTITPATIGQGQHLQCQQWQTTCYITCCHWCWCWCCCCGPLFGFASTSIWSILLIILIWETHCYHRFRIVLVAIHVESNHLVVQSIGQLELYATYAQLQKNHRSHRYPYMQWQYTESKMKQGWRGSIGNSRAIMYFMYYRKRHTHFA